MTSEANMQAVMKAVSQALQFDDSNNNHAAYIAYLHCVQQVSQLLLQDASKSVRVSPESSKCIQLGQHCMDRISKLYEGLPREDNVSKTPTHPPLPSVSTPTVANEEPRRPTSIQDTPTSLPELPAPNTLLQSYLKRSNEMSPMEVAIRKNQQLMTAYKNRMQRMSSKSHTATNISLSVQRRMAENVAIARAREQALAKKLQERQQRLEAEAARRFASTTGMSKDEQERRHIYSQVLMYEADMKPLSQWREKLAQNPEDPKAIQELIRFILSIVDHPLTQLLVRLQYKIYDRVRPVVRSYYHELNRLALPYIPSPTHTSNPSSKPSSPTSSREKILKNDENSTEMPTTEKDHPESGEKFTEICEANKNQIEKALMANEELSEKLTLENKEADKILSDLGNTSPFDDLFDAEEERGEDRSSVDALTAREIDIAKDLADITDEEKVSHLKKEALMKHREALTNDVKTAIEKLLSMFTVVYGQLDTPTGRDICWSTIEEPFFKPLWPYILTLFRLASYDLEKKAAIAMTNMSDISPRELDIKDQYYSTSSDLLPFQTSVNELRNLTSFVCPLAKLECTVKTCRQIIQSMEDSAPGGASATPAMGADDLLPVLAFVVIHSRLPELVGECHAMEEFIHEGYLMGEEGYCLTSLQTALNYVITMTDT